MIGNIFRLVLTLILPTFMLLIISEKPICAQTNADKSEESSETILKEGSLEKSKNPQKKIKKRKRKIIRWNKSWTTHLWLKGGATALQESPMTSEGELFETPKQSYGLLLQENFRTQKNRAQWVVRPSLEVRKDTYSLYPLEGVKAKNKVDLRLNELFIQRDITSAWILGFGLQNYQWGPAELMSPSNPIYHFAMDSQDPTYTARGHSLLRFNYSPDGNWSFVSLFEFLKNEEKEFIAEQEFTAKGLIKTEYRLPTPTDYLGLSFGNEQMHDTFIGEYANFTFDETFSVYFDMKQTRISRRYYPDKSTSPIPVMIMMTFHDSVYMLNVIGIRLEFEDYDIRWEEITNELGFNQTEMDLIGIAMSPLSSQAKENQNRFLFSGRELPSKSYSYLSIRMPNLITWADSSVSIRAIQSHRDQSGNVTLYWEGGWGDSWNFFLSGQGTYGKKGSEMTFLYKNKANAGLKYTW